MARTPSPYCPNCNWSECVRLMIRLSIKQQERFEGRFAHKFKQQTKGVGWSCLKCGAMFSDQQVDKAHAKAYNDKVYKTKVREACQKANHFLRDLRQNVTLDGKPVDY